MVLASAARERLAALLQRPDVSDALRVRTTYNVLRYTFTCSHVHTLHVTCCVHSSLAHTLQSYILHVEHLSYKYYSGCKRPHMSTLSLALTRVTSLTCEQSTAQCGAALFLLSRCPLHTTAPLLVLDEYSTVYTVNLQYEHITFLHSCISNQLTN